MIKDFRKSKIRDCVLTALNREARIKKADQLLRQIKAETINRFKYSLVHHSLREIIEEARDGIV